MNNDYKKSVLIFGMAVPILLIVLLTGGVLWKASSIHAEYEQKVAEKKKAKLQRIQNLVMQKKVKAHEKELSAWKALIKNETRASFNHHWKEVEAQFKAKEFIKERPVWKNNSTGLGKGVKQSASEVVITYDATFRNMQIALLEMETRLPQMQLDSFSMKPNPQTGLIHFKTTHTVWNNE